MHAPLGQHSVRSEDVGQVLHQPHASNRFDSDREFQSLEDKKEQVGSWLVRVFEGIGRSSRSQTQHIQQARLDNYPWQSRQS